MASSMAAPASASSLSQKQRKALLKKERRKRKRQALARARGQCEEDEESDAVDDEEAAEMERQRLHAVWLERERLAQEEFTLRHEREEAARQRKEEEERRIKEEWEAQQKKEEDDREQKQQEKREREEAVQKMLDQAESQLENGGPWMNPEAPVTENSVNYGTERDIANCPFFLKTGACRFGDRCSRKHIHPASSPTLMIRAMFVTFGMEQCRRDDYDTDACLEHSEEDLHEYFLEFYHDVLPEFKSVGKVLQFKVSCNFEPHLRGNVYVQFDTEEECRDAFVKFNGRYYAGKQLHCEICPVTRWKNAICGLFDRQKCPKGKHCNFLHVFRNPGNEFWEADRDLHMSPDRGGEGSYRAGRYSERCGERSWRQRNGSRSPPRSERSSYSRRGGERRRSRSRSRERSRDSRASHHQRADNRSSWSRSVSSRKEHYRSRSIERDRSRSRSAEREHHNRNKDRDRDKHRSRSRDRQSETVPGELERVRDRSRSRSTHRERRKQSSERSPRKSDRKDKSPDDTHTPRRHKHSKKSKKSKKKHKKKKSRCSEGPASSDESEEEQGEKNHPAASPGKEVDEVELVQNRDMIVNSRGDPNSDTTSVPELNSPSNSVVPNEATQNGDIASSNL